MPPQKWLDIMAYLYIRLFKQNAHTGRYFYTYSKFCTYDTEILTVKHLQIILPTVRGITVGFWVRPDGWADNEWDKMSKKKKQKGRDMEKEKLKFLVANYENFTS